MTEAATTVADVVGRTIARLGVGHAFGVVGSGNFVVTNALIAAGVPFTAARHEGGAATMADAFARTSGQVGVLSVHQGCGLTNAMTGITEAAKSRTPLLVLAAESAGAAVRSNFRIDQGALVSGVGAVAERVHSAPTAVADTTRAWQRARDSRRTVVLNLPLDVQAMPLDDPGPPALPSVVAERPPAPVAVAELAEQVGAAQRPVFIAGRGARGHSDVLRELARRCGALLATSAVAKGTFTGDAHDLGISGGFASPLAAELITGADLLVAWGASLTMWTLRHGRLVGVGAAVVQVDIDHEAIGVNQPVDLGVVGDVGETARALLELLGTPRQGYRTPEVTARIAAEGRLADAPYPDVSTDRTIDPRTLSREIGARLPSEITLAVDSGNFMGYPSAYWDVPDEQAFCFTQAFQSIGLGLATAIGAGLARPDRLPVLATGDGGLLMADAELETVARLGIPMLIVVFNDAAYGAEVHHFGPRSAPLSTVTFPDTDIAALARGFGLEAATIRSASDVTVLDSWLAGPRDRALLLDAKISNDGGSWWLAEAFRGH